MGGAGTAVPSLCMQRMGHAVLATDLPDIVPITRYNVVANRAESLAVTALSWGDESAARKCGHVDLVIGSDIMYDPSLFGLLLETLRCLKFERALFSAGLRPDVLGED